MNLRKGTALKVRSYRRFWGRAGFLAAFRAGRAAGFEVRPGVLARRGAAVDGTGRLRVSAATASRLRWTSVKRA